MLQRIREQSKSWIGYILAGFLILLFAIWGIADIFNPNVSRTAAVIEVGDVEVTGQEFQDTFRRFTSNLQRRTGQVVDYQAAKRLGLLDQLIERTTFVALFTLGAKDAGVAVSDAVVRADIRGTKAFQNPAGEFDRRYFQQALRNTLQMTESAYVAERRGEISRAQLAGTVASVGASPKSYLETLLRYRGERRVIDVLTVPDSSIKLKGKPGEATLRTFHKDNPGLFTVPVMRTVTAIVVKPQDVMPEIKVTEDEIKAAYASRRAEFMVPEIRQIEQVLTRDEAKAKKVYDAIKAGKSFAAAAKEVTGRAPLKLGKLKKADMPLAALGDAAFKLAKGGISKPVKSALGWHVLRVVDIVPARSKTIDQVRKELVEGVRKEKSIDVIAKLRSALDDAIGGGDTFEEAAKTLALKILKFPAIDVLGRDVEGKKAKNVPADTKFLVEVAKLKKGDDSLIVDMADGGFFVVRVDAVIASHVRPFEKVRERVRLAWTAEQRRKAAKKKAEAIAEKLKGGEKMTIIAAAENLDKRTTRPLQRGTQPRVNKLTAGFQARAFSSKKGEVFVGRVAGGYAAGIVTRIEPLDLAKNKKQIDRLSNQFRVILGEELLVQYAAALRARYGVTVDRKAIDNVFNPRAAN